MPLSTLKSTSAPIDIIYNMTSVCPHDCAACCVDATHVTRRGDDIFLRTDGLQKVQRVTRTNKTDNIFDTAAMALQKRGLELSLQDKLKIIDNIDIENVRLDISGGDPLVVTDNLTVLKEASKKLGRDFVTLTATGTGMAKVDLTDLLTEIGEFNFTYDSASLDDTVDRPNTYASRNLALGRDLGRLGAKTRAEFPITRPTSSPDHVERLYMQLHDAGIDKLLLMRIFTVGRGHTVAEKTLTPAEYRTVINQLRDLERRYKTPTVKLQCALRHLETNGTAGEQVNPCDFVRESFGLTPRGVLLASPWAINATGKPIDDAFVLGSLLDTPLSELLASDRVKEIRSRANENFGHCKIFAWQFSEHKDSFERLFDAADPLYAEASSAGLAAE